MFPFRARTAPPVLYHLHIPKAAGTTLYDLLRTRFPRRRRCPVRVSLLDLIRIPRQRFAAFDLVGGHLEFGYYLAEYMGRPVRAVTLLREPRAHLLSLYKQVMQEPLDPVRAYVDAHCPTVEDFFFDPQMAEYVADPQARFLAVAERRFTPAVVERLRGAGPAEVPAIVQQAADACPMPSPAETLGRARGRLDECFFVGLVERFDESADRLRAALGWPAFRRTESRNVSSVRVAHGRPSRRLLDRLDELTQIDRMLYEEAAGRFDAASIRRTA